MPRPSVVEDGLDAGGEALVLLDSAVARVAATMALGRGMPTPGDVRDAAEEILRDSVHAARLGLAAIDQAPTVALTGTAVSHLSGVQRSAGKLIRAAEREGIDVKPLRADLASLLRGNDIDYAKYGLDRTDLTGLRSVRADARRLVTDQVFRGTRAAAVERMQRDGQKVAYWDLSPSHKGPDECDELARRGPYPLDAFPEPPHPYCGCMPSTTRRA